MALKGRMQMHPKRESKQKMPEPEPIVAKFRGPMTGGAAGQLLEACETGDERERAVERICREVGLHGLKGRR